MSKCIKCGVEIVDQTERCPLCQHVLEHDGKDRQHAYPDVRVAIRRFRFFENLLLFLSIVLESFLIFLNVTINSKFLWSLIVGLVLIYINVVVRLAIVGRSGYLFKTVSLVVMAVIVLLGIDYLTGYRRWSLNFVLPGGILLMDVGIILLMIINHRNWQSYMMMQIFMILLSLIPLILLAIGIVEYAYPALAAMAMSGFLFLGTLILGDQRSRNELKRRFHI